VSRAPLEGYARACGRPGNLRWCESLRAGPWLGAGSDQTFSTQETRSDATFGCAFDEKRIGRSGRHRRGPQAGNPGQESAGSWLRVVEFLSVDFEFRGHDDGEV
jgi:hypothetical protein